MTDTNVTSARVANLAESGSMALPSQPPVLSSEPHQRLLTREDLCRMFGISARTTHYWVDQGRLPAPIRIGGKRYWQPHHIDLVLEAVGGAAIHQPQVPTPAEPRKPVESIARVPKSEAATTRNRPTEPHPSAVRAKTRETNTCEDIKRRLGLL